MATVIDALLELSVVGSFSRIGPAVRRRLDRWTEPAADALAGRTVLITGPTSGLGRAAAGAFAKLGARVVLLGRSLDKLDTLRAELARSTGVDRFPVVVADLGSLVAVRSAVDQVLATESRLDVLVDNAGAIFPERTVGPDGIESTFALMVVAPFVLTAGLLPLLVPSSGRVVAVTSGGMYAEALDLGDLESARGEWSGPRAYGREKRAQTALIREWARRLDGSGVTFAAMHPGWADTPGLADSLPGFHRFMGPLLRTPAEGVETIVWLATAAPSVEVNGRVILDRRPRPFDRVPATRLRAADRRRLWDLVVTLAGGTDPAPTTEPVAAGAVSI